MYGLCFFFFQAEDGIRDLVRSRGLGDVYKRQPLPSSPTAPHPLPLTPDFLKPVKAALLSPWEGVVQDQLIASCVPISVERARHSMVTMPIPLEPFTDYLLDIEMADKNAPNDAPGLVAVSYTPLTLPTSDLV